MEKLKLTKDSSITLRQGCEMYITDCRQRNLRDGTINHYKQSYTQFYKYFDPEMKINQFTENVYSDYVVYLCDTLENDVSINSYLRDLITTIHFLQKRGYVDYFEMRSIKVDKSNIQTYSDEELRILLKRPDKKQCSFTEYQCWVITNFLFSTGVRQHSLINIKIKDVDLYSGVVYINITKNRKPLIIPLNPTMVEIIKEYLLYRQHNNDECYLFCNVFGEQLVKSTCYHMLYEYNKRRGVQTTGIHRYRHTFAKQWTLNGGSVVSLQKMLGHSSLQITQNYINLLVSDVAGEVNSINLIDIMNGKNNTRISMKK